VLLDRAELELLFRDSGQAVSGAVREDALMLDAARQCTKPCAFAEACERLLDTRTGGARMDGCPMAELATLWLDSRNTASGRQLAALLWSLARDPRWVVGPLQDVVRGEIWVRALRLLGDRESPASVGPTPLAAGAQPA
jgi:hypothetical protein